jgi:hypothetical protein
MNKTIKIALTFFALSASIYGFLFTIIPNGSANGFIPVEYSNELKLDQEYVYNVTKFDSTLYWWGLDWNYKGDVVTNPGGQVIVNFTGFYAKHPNDLSPFPAPAPYIDITFKKYQTGMLITNSTFFNISNAEASVALAFGYNAFLSGFLIPVDDINMLKTQALAQNQSGFWEAKIYTQEYDNWIMFNFKKNDFSQNTTLIYDKTIGILVWAQVENNYGPDIFMTLVGYDVKFPEPNPIIPGFPFIIIFSIFIITITAIFIFSKKSSIKKSNNKI